MQQSDTVFVNFQKFKAMKNKIEIHLPAAMREIETFYSSNSKKPIKKEYKGYLSSLGASIRMSGLLPTMAVYYNKESNADREKVITWVYNIIQPIMNIPSDNKTLLAYSIAIQNDQVQSSRLLELIQNISVALKLCIRTFPLTK